MLPATLRQVPLRQQRLVRVQAQCGVAKMAKPQKKKMVAIIGAGLSGLVTAKSALEVGMVPTVFDKRPCVGGMWNQDSTAMYDALHTNLSRFTCSFSDFRWRESSPDFPTAKDMGAFLACYQAEIVSRFPECTWRYGCEVVQAVPDGDGSGAWHVHWCSASRDGPTESARFDAVIVASGFAAVPHLPPIPGLDTFPGQVLHSLAYRSAEAFAGRRVAVIGGGHSALDIASDLTLAGAAAQPPLPATSSASPPPKGAPSEHPNGGAPGPASVVHVFPRPMWVIPRYLPTNAASAAPTFVPLELLVYRRSRRAGDEEVLMPTPQQHQRSNAFFHSVCGDQGANISPLLAIPPDATSPPMLGICDAYTPLAATGRLPLRRGRVLRVSGSTLELSDGGPPLHDIDTLILCTGVRPHLPFLPDSVLQQLSYTPDDNFVPLALHRGVFHPDVPGLAFVGMYRGPYFGVVELQARLAAATLSGLLPPEPEEVQRAGVLKELRLREQHPRPALPHADYVGHISGMAAALGVLPDAEWRAAHDVVVPGHFGLVRPPWEQEEEQQQGQEHAVAGRPASSYATAQASVAELEDMLERYAAGRMVGRAVFHALHGEWRLHRRITSRLASSPSGVVTGSAFFHPVRLEEGGGGGKGSGGPLPFQYLYREQGQFAIDGGAVMRVRREYVYKYDNAADRLDVYFAEDGAGGNFFHSLRFLAPGEPAPALEEGAEVPSCSSSGGVGLGADGRAAAAGAGALKEAVAVSTATGTDDSSSCWRAVGQHLCVRDMYYSSYRFWFQGVRLRQFEIEFLVKGPNKDYTATAMYTRP